MSENKKCYDTPVITEVKFEDKNLVTFGFCSKLDGAHASGPSLGCCVNTMTSQPNSAGDPS